MFTGGYSIKTKFKKKYYINDLQFFVELNSFLNHKVGKLILGEFSL